MLLRRESFKRLLALCALPYLVLGSELKNQKCLIVYYTRTLNTHILSYFIQSYVGGELYRLETLKPYPKDYDAMVKLAAEEKSKGICPALLALPNVKEYDVILLGTPLWSLDISSPIRSFLAQSNLKGKILIPFISNAGYKFGNALDSIAKLAPEATIINAFEYKFELKEKTSRNLKSLNEANITQNTALNLLRQNELQLWLKTLKGA